MAKLSTYMSEARNSALPEKVLQESQASHPGYLRRHDFGLRASPEAWRSNSPLYGGPKICTVVASDALLGPIEAAIANGELAHSDETDDDYTGGGAHPGSSIVPATLAIGEKVGISGHALHASRRARLRRRNARLSYRRDGGILKHDFTCSWELSDRAAAAGCASSFNAQQMRWLLDYAAQQAGAGIASWRRDTDHIEKGFVFGGSSARNGVTAALMVDLGWTGVNDVLVRTRQFRRSPTIPKATRQR